MDDDELMDQTKEGSPSAPCEWGAGRLVARMRRVHGSAADKRVLKEAIRRLRGVPKPREGHPMTPEEYKALRKRVGSQRQTARWLGVHPMTISKRERGENGIDREAVLALRWIVEHVGEEE